MTILRKAGAAAAISVAGAGIAFGGVGAAVADPNTAGQDPTTQTDSSAASTATGSSAKPGEGRGHRPGGREGDRAAVLAKELGLQESDVTAAMKALGDQREPKESAEGGTRTRSTEAEREAHQAEMASALADELGVSEQKVANALESMAADRKAMGGERPGRDGAAHADKEAAKS